MNKVIVITGPTAIGKTDISLEIARIYNGEIINADASQFKRELNIGTAKIDLSKVDVIHHMIDIIGPTSNYSVSDFQNEGRKLIDDIISCGKTPIIVGGSGLYINSLMYDYDFSSPKRDESKYENLSNEELMEKLQELDLESSKKIPLNNRKRLVRALEVSESGKKISENICDNLPIYESVFICLNTSRDVLYERINKRVNIMIEEGLINECQELRNKGYDLEKIGDIGYLEINKYLNNEYSLDIAIDEIQKRTRHFAKRQMTWFRNKMNCQFVDVDYNNVSNTISEIKNIIESKNV